MGNEPIHFAIAVVPPHLHLAATKCSSLKKRNRKGTFSYTPQDDGREYFGRGMQKTKPSWGQLQEKQGHWPLVTGYGWCNNRLGRQLSSAAIR